MSSPEQPATVPDNVISNVVFEHRRRAGDPGLAERRGLEEALQELEHEIGDKLPKRVSELNQLILEKHALLAKADLGVVSWDDVYGEPAGAIVELGQDTLQTYTSPESSQRVPADAIRLEEYGRPFVSPQERLVARLTQELQELYDDRWEALAAITNDTDAMAIYVQRIRAIHTLPHKETETKKQ